MPIPLPTRHEVTLLDQQEATLRDVRKEKSRQSVTTRSQAPTRTIRATNAGDTPRRVTDELAFARRTIEGMHYFKNSTVFQTAMELDPGGPAQVFLSATALDIKAVVDMPPGPEKERASALFVLLTHNVLSGFDAKVASGAEFLDPQWAAGTWNHTFASYWRHVG